MRSARHGGVFHDFVSLFFPRYCVSCSDALVKGEEMICTGCMFEMPQTDFHMEQNNSLRNRLNLRFQLLYGMALFKFSKNGRVQELLHTLKYKNQPDLGISLGKLYGEKLLPLGYYRIWDFIIPVPLHPTRRRKRGYNQSAKFGEGLAEKLHVPMLEHALIRKVKTDTQTRKSKLNRWENVKEVFDFQEPAILKNSHVVLVDDVITTGATLEACANALMECGCASVSVACIAEA